MSNQILLTVNGVPLYERDPRVLFRQIVELSPNMEYWSPEALREYFRGILETLEEVCVYLLDQKPKGGEANRLRKFIEWSRRTRHFAPKSVSDLLTRFYNIAMQGEGLGLLKGYGFANRFGDPIKGNSEVESTMQEKMKGKTW